MVCKIKWVCEIHARKIPNKTQSKISRYLLHLRVWGNPRKILINRVKPCKKEFKTSAKGSFHVYQFFMLMPSQHMIDELTVLLNSVIHVGRKVHAEVRKWE